MYSLVYVSVINKLLLNSRSVIVIYVTGIHILEEEKAYYHCKHDLRDDESGI